MLMVNLRIQLASSMSDAEVRKLLPLTNHPDRGDVRDNGTGGGSSFRNYLDDRLTGEQFPRGTRIITASCNIRRLAGWCMVSRSYEVDNAFGIGFYVDPTFRRKGIAKKLFEQATLVAIAAGNKRLVASPWNERSRSFFQSLSFKEHRLSSTGMISGLVVRTIA